MRRLTPAAAGVSLADLESDWGAVFGAMAAEPVMRIRRAALARSLDRVGLGAELDRVAELFFARRFALTRPFPDALPALAALRGRYLLGYATNGNSRTDRVGLAGQFAFEVYAHEGGVPKKPAPDFFAAVRAAVGAVPAVSIVYVGDSPSHDVAGAQAAGLRAVWLNRAGLPRPPGLRPDARCGRSPSYRKSSVKLRNVMTVEVRQFRPPLARRRNIGCDDSDPFNGRNME